MTMSVKHSSFLALLVGAIVYVVCRYPRRPYKNPVIGSYLDNGEDRRQRLLLATVEQDYNDGFI